MPSSWIVTRPTKDGGKRYRVEYRLGGRESATRYGGSFRRKRRRDRAKAMGRRRAGCPPRPGHSRARPGASAGADAGRGCAALAGKPRRRRRQHPATASECRARRGARARLPACRQHHPAGRRRARCDPLRGPRRRETVRKMLLVLGMVFDHAGITPEPGAGQDPRSSCRSSGKYGARPSDRRSRPCRSRPPADSLPAAADRARRDGHAGSASSRGSDRGDVDESRGRWRVSQTVGARPDEPLGERRARRLRRRHKALVPRDDRTPDRPVFQGFGGDRFRTAGQPSVHGGRGAGVQSP